MNEPIMDTQAQAQSYLDKAETYKKLGLTAQVQYELEQARKVDPYITQEHRYKTLLEAVAAALKTTEALKTPLRIGAGMLFVNGLLGIINLILIFMAGDAGNLTRGEFLGPIVNIVIGANLWQLKVSWQKYTVWWAVIGLVLFGFGALINGDIFGLIIQLGFSGSLILLLAGTPTKARTIASVVIFSVLFLGSLCLIFTLSFLSGVLGAA